MTAATSNVNEERQVDVTLGAIKRSLEWAYKQYNDCQRDNYVPGANYWNGYIRAMQRVLEMENE